MDLTQLVGVCWLIFILYWLVSAQSVKPIQETRGWLARNWYSILFFLGVLLMSGFRVLARFDIPVRPLGVFLIPHTLLLNIVVVILMISGLAIALIARRTLGKNWSGIAAIKKDHELITTGLYHYVRNPIYTGMLLMFLGTALSFDTLSACIGFLLILLTIWVKLKQEEALLTEHFAGEYLSYKNRTKMLIPFIW
jgi:protein-S-isoprenylcysteine O-methyltransferase Ste14